MVPHLPHAVILIIIFSASAFCQQCQTGWYGYSLTSKCYKFNVGNKLTWQDARDYCQTFQGDLLRIDTAAELKWVLAQVTRNYRQHAHYNGQIWTGLNNREYLTTWEWADGTAAGSFIPWNPHEPNNYRGKEGCAEIVGNGKFNDDVCSNKYPFICYRNRGVPILCDSDHGWQSFNGQCYKVYTAKKNWIQANRQCSHDGGSMVYVNDTQTELVLHGLASDSHQPLWIGLSTQKLGNNPTQWLWSNDQSTLQTAYWHGNPHIDRAHQNGTCATVSNTLPYMTAWNPSLCTVPRAYVCQKPEGVCLPGWIGHRRYCWQFNLNYKLNFNAASSYCNREGGKLASAKAGSDQMFLQGYLKLIRDSSITSFWIGISDNNKDNGPFLWRDGSRVNPWRPRTYHPRNTAHRQDCGYIATNDLSGNWKVTSNCAQAKAFVCKIPMGRKVNNIRTPRPSYGCPSGWRMNSHQCFKVIDQGLDYLHARNNCRKAQGADLAKITTSNMEGFVNHLLRRDISYWIGLNDRVKNGAYVWNDETIASTYTNWAPHEPNNYGAGENCVVNKNGKWNDFACNRRTQSICSMSASPGFVFSLPPTTPPMDWTVKCGQGWDSNPTSDYCYFYGDTPLSWLDALNSCKGMHGDLLSIESIEEQNYIAGKMSAMGSIAVWTGANDRGTEGGWTWSSGRPFSFLNWAANQPATGGQSRKQNCVAMFTQTAKWDDADCHTRNGYICEKKGNVPTTSPPRSTTPHIPAGMVLGCQPGWLPFRESCYRVVSRPGSWDAAQKVCGQMGSKLTSIRDKPEQDFITGNLRHVKNSWDGYWIGLTDKQIDNRFQWTDASTVTYTSWNVNEPNNWHNRNEDCVLMVHTNGKWNDEVCSESRAGFVCKKLKAAVSATQSPYQKGCPLYSEGHGPLCYRQIAGHPLSWSAANAKCGALFKGTLAVINDRFLQAFLSSTLVWKRGYFWIGLSDTAQTGKLNWTSGETIRYTNWYNTHTGNERSTCVALRTMAPTGLWENRNCSSSNYYICQFPRTGYTPLPTPTPYPNVPCPTGWTAYNAFCYRAYPDPKNLMTWMDASGFCQSLGGNLPSFHVNQNDSIMDTLLANYRGKNFWIGFNDRDKEAGHVWSDGSAVDFTHWNYGEPNDFKGYEDCVVYNVGSHWNDLNCYYASSFVCAVPRGTNVSAPTQAPTGVPSPKCPGSNWLLIAGNCYWFSPATGENSSLTWYDANTYCQGMQSNLASIHNQTEQNFIVSMLSKTSAWSSWVGLNMLEGDAYQWSDHTPVDYSFWSPGQPDNYFGSERCVHIQNYGLWQDDHCSNPKKFICEKPLNGQAQIFTPAPYPSGGCRSGFTRVPGGRNKCFYIAGVQNNLQNRRNWTEAYKYCRRFGTGYDIAAIEDLYEQEFLLTMTTGIKQSLWIGLTDNRGNGRFIWQSNVPTIYTNWDKAEPTSSIQHGQQASAQNCVLMRMNTNHEGRWADAYCSLNLGFVCQAKQDPNIPVVNPPRTCTKSGYQSYMYNCYTVKRTAKTWTDAQADCKADGGNLVSFNNVQEAAFIQTLVKSKFQYWIGLSDKQMKGFYSWVDGWPLFYSNWGWKEPTYTQNSSTGCVLVNMNGKWNDTDCSRTLNYACKISTTTAPPSPPPAIGSCANSKWTKHGQFCYFVYVTNGRSWPEANYLCQSNGQQLASIHSQDELSFVVNLVRQAKTPNPQYRPNVWVGLSQGGHGSYEWSDGTAINFMKWRVGEPTKLGTHGQVEQCVELDRDNAAYNDIDCFTNRGYVCKSPLVTSTPASQGGQVSQGSNIGVPTGPNGLPTYKINTGSGGVLPGAGSSNLPFVTYPNGVVVTDANGNAVTAARLTQKEQVNTTTLGLSSGGIAGVVIGILILLVLVAGLLVYLKRNGQIKAPSLQENDSLGFDNALYSKGNDAVQLPESDA